MEGILCLINRGIGLNDEDRRMLMWFAQKMYGAMKQQMKIATNNCEGVIKTDFVTKTVGTFSGIVFTAELITNRGKVHTTYAVRKKKITEKEFDNFVFQPTDYTFDLDVPLN